MADQEKTVKAEKVETPSNVETKATVEPSKKDNTDTFAIIAIVLGVINLGSWIIPCCGFIFTIAGLVFGFLGLKSEKYKTFVIIAMVVAGLAIIGSIVNAVLGAAMYSNMNFSEIENF